VYDVEFGDVLDPSDYVLKEFASLRLFYSLLLNDEVEELSF
jgi:hypothetical protein